MGVTIGGVRHEELADPGGGSYASAADYAAAAGPASQQGGQNLNWGGGTNNPSAAPTVNNAAGSQLASGINSLLGAIASGNKQAFDEAVRQFNTTFGLDQSKFTEAVRQFNENLSMSQAGLTGQYQGTATLPALTGYANQFGTWGVPQQGAQTLASQAQNAGLYGFNPTLGANGVPMGPNGQPLTTLAAQQQTYAQQLGAINAASALQANPFRQQQVIGQLGQVLGGGGVAGFSAPNTVQGVGTAGGNTQGGLGYMSQLINDIRDPSANSASMNSVLNAIPTPSKLNSVEFLRAAPSTQNLVLQGMSEKYGLDPQDSLAQIKNTLPGFQTPTTMGTLKR